MLPLISRFVLLSELHTPQPVAAQQVHTDAKRGYRQEFLVDDQSRRQAGQIRTSQVSSRAAAIRNCDRARCFRASVRLPCRRDASRMCRAFAQSHHDGEHRQSGETTRPLEEDRRRAEERRAVGGTHFQSQQQRRRRPRHLSGQSSTRQRISALVRHVPVRCLSIVIRDSRIH